MGRNSAKLHREYDCKTGQVIAEGARIFNERQGVWVHWYPSGERRARGVYSNDLESGRWSYWYKNGQRAAEGELVEGMEDGPWTYWYDDASIMCQGTYAHGEQIGRWTHRGQDGRVTRVEIWHDGAMVRCLELVGDRERIDANSGGPDTVSGSDRGRNKR